MNKFRTSINMRLLVLGGMILAFIIPLFMISSLIEERSTSRTEASEEIGGKWGGSQTIAGPILVIPYNLRIPKSGSTKSKDKWDYITEYAYFLPDQVNYEANLKTEIRKRSIYETPLYTGKISSVGQFQQIQASDFPLDTTYIYYEDAKVVFSITDVRGLGGDMKLLWAGKQRNILPGTRSGHFPHGLHSAVQINPEGNGIPFDFSFELKGSSRITFLPIGKTTKLVMNADWKDPSFSGHALPKDRSISDSGFSAIWEESYFGRSYGQNITVMDDNMAQTILASGSGVDLVQGVDYYHQLQRSAKYGLLILITSFTLFFLMEIFGGVILHPIQYLLIGSAMLVFYVLNLSLSEHIGFLSAYIIASLAVTSLIGYYAVNVLRNKRKGLITSSYYGLLYTFLYVILASEDQALLLGSFAIFIVLAAVMHFTRKIDWYQFGMD
jgi:inner membrane protein